jgi:hypothetical protein
MKLVSAFVLRTERWMMSRIVIVILIYIRYKHIYLRCSYVWSRSVMKFWYRNFRAYEVIDLALKLCCLFIIMKCCIYFHVLPYLAVSNFKIMKSSALSTASGFTGAKERHSNKPYFVALTKRNWQRQFESVLKHLNPCAKTAVFYLACGFPVKASIQTSSSVALRW